MGPELAEAVFTVFFNRWNSNRNDVNEDDESDFDDMSDLQCQLNSTEKFCFGGSSAQSLSSSNANQQGKWVASKSTPGFHELVKRITTLRLLKALNPSASYLMNVVSRLDIVPIVLSRVSGSLENNIINANSFGYSISGDEGNLHDKLAHQIIQLLTVSSYSSVMNRLKAKGITKSSDLKFISEKLYAACGDDPKRAADYLGITLVLFTDLAEIPALPVFPEEYAVHGVWIFLCYSNGKFYLCEKASHGNQLTDPSQPPSKKRKMTPSICNCGRSTANPTKKFCTLNDDGYSSRCPCLKSESGCVNCMCKCCDNPFGVNKSKTQPTRSRKREKAELSMKRETGQGFMTQAGEEAKKGPWSDVETLLLFTLLEQNNAVNTTSLLKSYNANAKVLQEMSYQIDLKSIEQLRAKITNSTSELAWFDGIIKQFSM